MRPHDIQCRCCHERYNTQEHGCEICKPAKQNIIWPKVELPLLESILAQSLRIVDDLAQELEWELAEKRKNKRRGIFFDHVKAAKILSDANVALVAEARKIRKEDAQVAANLSWDQKVELMLNAVEEMPLEKRQLFLNRMVGRLQATEAKLLTEGEDE